MSNENYEQGKSFFDFISDCATVAGIIYMIILLFGSAFGGYNIAKIIFKNESLLAIGGIIGLVAGFAFAVVTLSPIAILKQIKDQADRKNTIKEESAKPEIIKQPESANINEDLNQY